MVAVPETDVLPRAARIAAGPSAGHVHHRRFVAVAVDPMELLRPESDLARLAAAAELVDLLVVCDDEPSAVASPLGTLGARWPAATFPPGPGASSPPGGRDVRVGDGEVDRGPEDDPGRHDDTRHDDDPGDEQPPTDDVAAAVAQLDLPALSLHRLALRAPLTPAVEDDLIAALSELVGFDPEPGVCCLAPALPAADPNRPVVERVVRRIAQVYGLPLLRYRCHGLCLVEEPDAAG
jgi:hypothetical protein